MHINFGNLPHAFEYVLLAALICVMSSWVGFRWIGYLKRKPRESQWVYLAAPAMFGVGVWSTHFIAILGIRPDFLLSYAVGETFGSLCIAVIFIGGPTLGAAIARSNGVAFILAAVAGLGVSAMHHIGMAGLSGCIVSSSIIGAALFSGVCVAFSTIALFVVRAHRWRFASKASAIYTLGVASLHFGAIATTSIQPGPLRDLVISDRALGVLQIFAVLILVAPTLVTAKRMFQSIRMAHLSGQVAKATGEGVAKLDLAGNVLWVNDAFHTLSGGRFFDIVGRSSIEAVDKAASPEHAASYRNAIATGQSDSITIRGRRPDRERFWQNVRLLPRRRPDGKLTGFVTVHRDITLEKEAADKLILSEARASQLALVAEHANDAVLILDEGGKALWANPSFERMTGHSANEVAGRQLSDLLFDQNTHTATIAAISRALATASSLRIELQSSDEKGHPYWIELEISVVEKAEEALQFVAVSRDVTDRIQREERLRHALSDAEAADRTKSEFLARMSHEIRTPMNGVTGMASLLATTKLDEKQSGFLDHIQTSSDRLLRLLNDILDISALDAGQISLSPVDFELGALMDEVISVVMPLAVEKNLQINAVIGEGCPDYINADDGRLRQVLLNLISNAVKFTEAGGVNIAVEPVVQRDGIGAHAQEIRFIVTDTGSGIPKGSVANLFDRFTQVDETDRRSYEGSGLGLAIARGIVEAMGGTIELHSSGSSGSVFVFTIIFHRLPGSETGKGFDA